MNEKQRQLCEKRLQEARKEFVFNSWMGIFCYLIGILTIIVLIGVIFLGIGLYFSSKVEALKKEIAQLEITLAEE